jgi:hypothetical protein
LGYCSIFARSANRVENILLPNISKVTEIISDERLRRIERVKSTARIYWQSRKNGGEVYAYARRLRREKSTKRKLFFTA